MRAPSDLPFVRRILHSAFFCSCCLRCRKLNKDAKYNKVQAEGAINGTQLDPDKEGEEELLNRGEAIKPSLFSKKET